jgi:hypothetical protein
MSVGMPVLHWLASNIPDREAGMNVQVDQHCTAVRKAGRPISEIGGSQLERQPECRQEEDEELGCTAHQYLDSHTGPGHRHVFWVKPAPHPSSTLASAAWPAPVQDAHNARTCAHACTQASRPLARLPPLPKSSRSTPLPNAYLPPRPPAPIAINVHLCGQQRRVRSRTMSLSRRTPRAEEMDTGGVQNTCGAVVLECTSR